MFFNIDEVLAMAQQIERNGAQFYRLAADLVSEPEARELMKQLSEWEAGHERIFAQVRAELAGERRLGKPFDPDGEAELYLRAVADQHVFRREEGPERVLAECASSDDLLDVALRFEKDTIALFVGLQQTMPDPQMAGEVNRLILEELRHVGYLHRVRAAISSAGAS